jgi:hypothetical protein
MSYVGGRFKYDLFFSYAVAEDRAETDELGRWSRCVIDAITTRMKVALNGRLSSKRRFRAFRDDQEITSGAPITDTLEDAVKSSALIVVLISPFYWSRPWCRRELTWWHESVTDVHEYSSYLLQIQTTARAKWPPLLKDREKVPFNAAPFMDETDLPAGLLLPCDQVRLRLDEQISKAADVLVDRLEEKRKLQAAQDRRKAAAAPGDERVIFLEAENDDLVQRTAVYQASRDRQVKVIPRELVGYVSGQPGSPARLSPEQFYPVCNSLVLLRTRRDDMIELRLVKARMDRDERRAARKPLAWAVCNAVVGEPVPSADVLGVPVVDREGDRWIDELLARLA